MRKQIRVIVVDDEPLGRDGLILRLKRFDNVEVVGVCQNTAEAEHAIAEHDPDLIFLDIEMPEETGIDFIPRRQSEVRPFVVFVTAYKNHAIEAFDLDVVDYLLKPINQQRLEKALVKVEDRLNSIETRDASDPSGFGSNATNKYLQRLKIKDGDTSALVACSDIL